MRCDAIVNTANTKPIIGSGCDYAVYKAAGKRRLSEYREKNIGEVPEGDVFLTPGFRLPARYIIHAVSPLYIDGAHGEEEKLRVCYRKSLSLAWEQRCRSIAFPVISTGSFGYPKQEGIRIAADEIQAFLQNHETRDLLARAGYALSPCDKTDIIFSYFIENQIYDMIELDIQLEEHGLSCLI